MVHKLGFLNLVRVRGVIIHGFGGFGGLAKRFKKSKMVWKKCMEVCVYGRWFVMSRTGLKKSRFWWVGSIVNINV